MLKCNEHVEINKFVCSLTCTWMAIIDSQFYSIDSLFWDVWLEWNAILVVAWLYPTLKSQISLSSVQENIEKANISNLRLNLS